MKITTARYVTAQQALGRKQDMREHILKVVDDLFYREGIRSVGMDKVIAVADIAKATLYRHFPTKDQLVLAYLQQRHDNIMRALEENLFASEGRAPEERIATLFDWLIARVDTGAFRGCAFLLALGEYSHVSQVHEFVRAHKQAIRAVFQSAIGEDLAFKHPTLAHEVALIYDGGLASAAVSRDSSGINVALRLAYMLVQRSNRS